MNSCLMHLTNYIPVHLSLILKFLIILFCFSLIEGRMSEKSSGCHVTTYMVYVVVMVTLRLIEARELRIAWMAPKEQHYNFSASGSVGALKLALDTIRDDPNLLPGHTLRYMLVMLP